MSTKPSPVLESSAAPPAPPPKKKRLLSLDNRYLAPLLITCILVVGQLTYGIIELHFSPLLARLTFGLVTSYSPTFVAILVCIGMELALGRALGGRWPHLASAYISGISVGILVRSTELWPYVLCGAISIVSKYAIRFRGRHLWNPSNLGVSVMLFLAPEYVASLSLQWGNEIWPLVIIWCLGVLILYRLGFLHITLTYVVSFVLLSFVRSAVTSDPWLSEVAPITGPMYQLFIFFMITDPKTTTRTKARQCAVAVLVAVVETVLRLQFKAVNAPFYALFIVGPLTNFLEILWDGRRAAARQPALGAAGAAAPAGNGPLANASGPDGAR
jgi:Na+-translocating ferredoxin:NAD+ oxidoreductase RnfD subunit